MTLRIAIMCLAASVLWGQTSERETVAAGRVVSAADGSPLFAALVMSPTGSRARTWTGPDGRFRLVGVPTGPYVLLASKAGFHRNERRQQSAEGDGQEIVIRLTPESLIAGTAVDSEGAPMEGATITLWEQPDRLGNVPTLSGRQNVTVDDLGRFRLHGLRAGNYVLALEPAAAPAPDGVERLAAPPMLYPQPSGKGDLATLRIRPGERVENVDFRAGEAGQTAWAGQVSGCGSCFVGIYRRSGEFFAPVYNLPTAENGSFYVEGLAPGDYVVAARSGGRGGRNLVGLAEISLRAGQTVRTQVYLSEGAQMTITKKHLNQPEEAQPTQQRGSGAPSVTFEYLGPQLVSGMQRGNGFARGPMGGSAYEVGLTPGPYAIRVRGIPRGGYLASVLVDGRPPLDGRFVVADGGAHQTEVVIAYDSGAIDGTATAPDGSLLQNAEIYLLPQNPVLPSDLAQTSADETGAFSIAVGPGRYDVYALPRDADWNLADPMDRQRLAGYRASVEARTGQTATVKVKLAPLSSW